MSTINIYLKNKWDYTFSKNHDEYYKYSRKCSYCNTMKLDGAYCYIINNLKEAGLLDKNYKEICCVCLVLKRFGLLYLHKKLIAFYLEEENDRFIMKFLYNRKPKSNELLWERAAMFIRIHDWSKIELF